MLVTAATDCTVPIVLIVEGVTLKSVGHLAHEEKSVLMMAMLHDFARRGRLVSAPPG